MMPVYAVIPGRAGRVRVGEAERDGDTVRVRLDAMLSGAARVEIDLPALAIGEALLRAIDAARPYYGTGPDSAVRVYCDADGSWCAGRNDDLAIRAEGCDSIAAALDTLTAELRAEYARRCPHCGIADDHAPEDCHAAPEDDDD